MIWWLMSCSLEVQIRIRYFQCSVFHNIRCNNRTGRRAVEAVGLRRLINIRLCKCFQWAAALVVSSPSFCSYSTRTFYFEFAATKNLIWCCIRYSYTAQYNGAERHTKQWNKFLRTCTELIIIKFIIILKWRKFHKQLINNIYKIKICNIYNIM